MKEMKYTKERRFDILYAGTYRDLQFWVISYGTHPCAYVDATRFKDKLGEDLMHSWAPIHPHGGITYDDDKLLNVWDETFNGFERAARRIIGWDYCHLGDFDARLEIDDGTKWTTSELVDEAKEVIDELYNL